MIAMRVNHGLILAIMNIVFSARLNGLLD
jgi:hypothetical protein